AKARSGALKRSGPRSLHDVAEGAELLQIHLVDLDLRRLAVGRLLTEQLLGLAAELRHLVLALRREIALLPGVGLVLEELDVVGVAVHEALAVPGDGDGRL